MIVAMTLLLEMICGGTKTAVAVYALASGAATFTATVTATRTTTTTTPPATEAGKQRLTSSSSTTKIENAVDRNAHHYSNISYSNGDDDDMFPQRQPQYKLPRVEVQFICSHDVRPDFDVRRTFQALYEDLYLPNLHKVKLYPSISISDMDDVKATHWYYPLCNQSSSDVLATMDVKGYVSFAPVQSSKQSHATTTTNGNVDMEYAENVMVGRLVDTMEEHDLEEYFRHHVCDDMPFFRSKVVHWNAKLDPPPPPSSSSSSFTPPLEEEDHAPPLHPSYNNRYNPDQHSDSFAHSNSARNNNNNQYQFHDNQFYFDHNLYLLCGGAEELLQQGEAPDPGFMVFGILVGMVMIAMICSELGQWTAGYRRRRRSESTAGAASSTAAPASRPRRGEYAATPVHEVEMTMV